MPSIRQGQSEAIVRLTISIFDFLDCGNRTPAEHGRSRPDQDRGRCRRKVGYARFDLLLEQGNIRDSEPTTNRLTETLLSHEAFCLICSLSAALPIVITLRFVPAIILAPI
jgi:hypothetical protein